MEVSVTTLRSELAAWLDRVRAGEEVVVTDRGTPVARLAPVAAAPLIQELTERGVLTRPGSARPSAQGAARIQARGSVSDLVADQRR